MPGFRKKTLGSGKKSKSSKRGASGFRTINGKVVPIGVEGPPARALSRMRGPKKSDLQKARDKVRAAKRGKSAQDNNILGYLAPTGGHAGRGR